MYRYVDRDLTTLDTPDQMLVRAMRDWLVAAQRGRCPLDAVACRFLPHGLIGAVEPLSVVMALLARYGRHRLAFGCPCQSRIEEGEAIALSLLAPSMAGDGAAAGLIEHLFPPERRREAGSAVAELQSAIAIAGFRERRLG